MESESSPSTRIDKLTHKNYHVWKQRIIHLLALRDLDEYIDEDPPSDDSTSITVWRKKDRKAQAIIGLTLSDELLENVRESQTAKQMWTAIKNVFERHTLLNKLAARRKFYTATMNETETVLQFANRIRQLASTLKSMNVTIDESEMAMALLNGLPDQYNSLISALDAIGNEDDKLEFDHVKARIMQEEQRMSMRITDSTIKAETAALLSQQGESLSLIHI